MQLYLKQKAFSWRDRFAVHNAEGGVRWYAEGKPFSWARELCLYDAQGVQAAVLRRKNWTFLTQEYHICLEDGRTLRLVKEPSFLKQRFRLEGLPWRMEGDVWAHEYTLVDEAGQVVMHLAKEWFAWADSYRIDIASPQHELLCLCIVLAVDCMRADAGSATA